MKYTQKLFVRKVKPISNLYINSVLIFITISSNIEYEKRSIADKTVRYRGQQTRNRDSPISSMHFGRFNPNSENFITISAATTTITTADLSAVLAAPDAHGHPSKKYTQGIRKREKVVRAD